VSAIPTSRSSSSTGAISSASPSTSISISPADRIDDDRIGEVYLTAAELGARVRELGAEIALDYEGREPVLVGSLKASLVFIADLSRALPIVHALDFVELAGYGSAQMGGHEQIRVLKDLDLDIRGRDVLVVEDVVDTGLTLNYLVRTFELREPRSIAAVTLLDRPYRRLVDDLPVRYVGFVVPDELFVGYGFDLEERYRELPDLRLLQLEPPPTS
jgi:hypoxanthine phosphoribosyltransferase